MIEVKDLGYFTRFYGPVNEEVKSMEPPILTPERMAHDWWGYQAFQISSNGEPLMDVHKEYGGRYEPGYSIMWRYFLGDTVSGELFLDKLVSMLGLHADLTERGLDLGKSKIQIYLRYHYRAGRFEAFLLDQTHLPQNQQLIRESSIVDVQSDWLRLFVDKSPWNLIGIRSRYYFGVGEIMAAFKSSYFNSNSLALDELDASGQCLDDLIRNFPEAPKVKS